METHLSSYCDGKADCDDISDESECTFCGSNSYACNPSEPNNDYKICIPPNQKCDHIKQCPLGDDEMQCGGDYEDYECKQGQYYNEATKQCNEIKAGFQIEDSSSASDWLDPVLYFDWLRRPFIEH